MHETSTPTKGPADAQALIAQLDIDPNKPYATRASLYAQNRVVRPELCINLETGSGFLGEDDEGQSGGPPSYWHRRIVTVQLPGFATGLALAEWLVQHHADVVVAAVVSGSNIEWNGHNFVGVLSAEAEDALEGLRADARETIDYGDDARYIETDGEVFNYLNPDWRPGDPPMTAREVQEAYEDVADDFNVIHPYTDFESIAESLDEVLREQYSED